MSDVTRILESVTRGEAAASDRLLPLVYEELRKMAAAKMAREAPDHTLQPTALVHEAYLRLVSGEASWDSRAHFFAAAAEAMRRILVDQARRKLRIKRGGGRQRIPLDEHRLAEHRDPYELLMVNEALDDLARSDEQAAQLVRLHYFGGCTMEESAATLGISTRTAYRDWAFARAWLRRQIGELPPSGGS